MIYTEMHGDSVFVAGAISHTLYMRTIALRALALVPHVCPCGGDVREEM